MDPTNNLSWFESQQSQGVFFGVFACHSTHSTLEASQAALTVGLTVCDGRSVASPTSNVFTLSTRTLYSNEPRQAQIPEQLV